MPRRAELSRASWLFPPAFASPWFPYKSPAISSRLFAGFTGLAAAEIFFDLPRVLIQQQKPLKRGAIALVGGGGERGHFFLQRRQHHVVRYERQPFGFDRGF